MGRLQTITLVAVVAMCVAAAEATELVLADAGKSPYTIVTSPVPDPAEAHAAKDPQALLKQISGAEFRLCSTDSPLPPFTCSY